MRKNKGITLIALIITIIVLLILAGITISLTLGEHGILNLAKEAKVKTEEEVAREKLELVLLDLQAKKHTDTTYNETDYIDKEIRENGMAVEGDIVFVNGWQFQIDRSVPKIGISLGKTDNIEAITTKQNALVLDGDTYIDTNLEESDFIQSNGRFTVAARVKISKVGQQSVNHMGILGNHVNANGQKWQFAWKTSELIIDNKVVVDYTPYYNQWVDIVETYENGNIRVYINGEFIEQGELTLVPYGHFLIGTGYTVEDRRMKGMIASVKVWNEKLEEEEIKKLFLLTEKTKIKSDNIRLEAILDSMEDINKIGTINGNNRFELRNFSLEYALRFLGGTAISTEWQQNDIFGEDRKFTIATRIKINRQEQASVEYMDILGNHVNSSGYVWQFNGTTTQLGTWAGLIDYTPYYDQWIDLVEVYEGENSKIYVNGQLVAEAKRAVVPYSNFLLGTGYLKKNRAMKGSIASVKMWKTALTQQEIEKIDMLKQENIQQENIVNNVILENDEAIEEIGSIIGAAYTYILRH